MTVAILIIVIFILLSEIGAASLRRQSYVVLATELKALREQVKTLHEQLERRLF